MVMIAINQSFATDLAMRKVNQISFSIMDLLLVQISIICILLGTLEGYVKCKWVYASMRFSSEKSLKRL